MTRRYWLIGLGLLVAGALSCGAILIEQPHWLVAELAERSPNVLYFVETDEPVVALTFDDGPDSETTPEILRLLARHGARATFFLIGERVAGNESLVARIVSEGHELGNHLTRDRPSLDLSPEQFELALLETERTLSPFAPLRWFRPGGGLYDDRMLSIAAEHGYRCALGSVYPYDATIPWSWYAVFHVLHNVEPGSIIVLHDAGARGLRTAKTLERMLPALRRRGFRVVSLSELVTSQPRAGVDRDR